MDVYGIKAIMAETRYVSAGLLITTIGEFLPRIGKRMKVGLPSRSSRNSDLLVYWYNLWSVGTTNLGGGVSYPLSLLLDFLDILSLAFISTFHHRSSDPRILFSNCPWSSVRGWKVDLVPHSQIFITQMGQMSGSPMRAVTTMTETEGETATFRSHHFYCAIWATWFIPTASKDILRWMHRLDSSLSYDSTRTTNGRLDRS